MGWYLPESMASVRLRAAIWTWGICEPLTANTHGSRELGALARVEGSWQGLGLLGVPLISQASFWFHCWDSRRSSLISARRIREKRALPSSVRPNMTCGVESPRFIQTVEARPVLVLATHQPRTPECHMLFEIPPPPEAPGYRCF